MDVTWLIVMAFSICERLKSKSEERKFSSELTPLKASYSAIILNVFTLSFKEDFCAVSEKNLYIYLGAHLYACEHIYHIYVCTVCVHTYLTYVCAHTVKPLYPTTPTDRPLSYIDRFISVSKNRSPMQIFQLPKSTTSLNRPLKIGPMVYRFREVLLYIQINVYGIYIYVRDSALYKYNGSDS